MAEARDEEQSSEQQRSAQRDKHHDDLAPPPPGAGQRNQTPLAFSRFRPDQEPPPAKLFTREPNRRPAPMAGPGGIEGASGTSESHQRPPAAVEIARLRAPSVVKDGKRRSLVDADEPLDRPQRPPSNNLADLAKAAVKAKEERRQASSASPKGPTPLTPPPTAHLAKNEPSRIFASRRRLHSRQQTRPIVVICVLGLIVLLIWQSGLFRERVDQLFVNAPIVGQNQDQTVVALPPPEPVAPAQPSGESREIVPTPETEAITLLRRLDFLTADFNPNDQEALAGAVALFQEMAGLPVTGRIDDEVMTELREVAKLVNPDP